MFKPKEAHIDCYHLKSLKYKYDDLSETSMHTETDCKTRYYEYLWNIGHINPYKQFDTTHVDKQTIEQLYQIVNSLDKKLYIPRGIIHIIQEYNCSNKCNVYKILDIIYNFSFNTYLIIPIISGYIQLILSILRLLLENKYKL